MEKERGALGGEGGREESIAYCSANDATLPKPTHAYNRVIACRRGLQSSHPGARSLAAASLVAFGKALTIMEFSSSFLQLYAQRAFIQSCPAMQMNSPMLLVFVVSETPSVSLHIRQACPLHHVSSSFKLCIKRFVHIRLLLLKTPLLL